jgi:mono/diheme cytochrome c family protein
MVIVTLLARLCLYAQANDQSPLAQKVLGKQNVAVSAVSGESWLAHLHRSFDETSMGKTGRLGPPAPQPGEMASPWQPYLAPNVTSHTLTLHGSDLYRLNCQGCHGESGQGAPPEINSVINPVRATSVALVMERMKTTGMDISRADAVKLAQQSNSALLLRLHNGGENMPPFPHLNEGEIGSLFAYLKQLAGIPGAEGEQIAVQESPIRVGEHIVKSTCHTCHGALGPDPDVQELWDGAIPPLSVLTTRKSRPEFIRKVTRGAPILMGAQPTLYRGRMPVFYYLSDDEAADVYLYLTQYPPLDSANSATTIALSQQGPAGGEGTPPPQKAPGPPVVPDNKLPDVQQASRPSHVQTVTLVSAVVAFVILLLGGGLGFTLFEFHRLSATTQVCSVAVQTRPIGRTKDAPARLQKVS